MKIALIGAGNVGWHLAKTLDATQHQVTAVYSRTAATREALAQQLNHALPIDNLNLTLYNIDVVLLAVSDAALAEVTQELAVRAGTIVCHTSGSQPLTVLQPIQGARTGVFYPLQTFTKSKPVNLTHTPFLLEAADEETLGELQQLAAALSDTVLPISSSARKQLHLAAVFACNFTNHLLGISRELLEMANLPPDLLQPLIQETVDKALQRHPFLVQTGPAIRRDQNVLQAHLGMLQQYPQHQELYRQLTQSIQAQLSAESKSKTP